MKKSIMVLLVAFAILGLSGCTSNMENVMKVSARECGNGPQLEDATLTVSNADGIVGQVFTDAKGIASIAVGPGTYEVVLAKEGYEFYKKTKEVGSNGAYLAWCLEKHQGIEG